MDIGSDVIDWLTVIPPATWTAIGIVASVIAAVAASGTLARPLLRARHDNRVSKRIVEFLDEAQAEFIPLHRAGMKHNVGEVFAWSKKIEEYLENEVGTGAAGTFRNASDPAIDVRADPSSVTNRTDVLLQILADLKH